MILKRPAIVVDRDPPPGPFLAAATFLPIARWRDVLPASRLSSRVEGQLRRSPGIVCYSLAVNPLRRHFWTYSLWTDRDAMAAFARGDRHAVAIGRYEDWAGERAAFVEWEAAHAKLDWSEAFAQLKSRGS
jgi:hypothetical protein